MLWWSYELIVNLIDAILIYFFLKIFLKSKPLSIIKISTSVGIFAIIIHMSNMVLGMTSFLTILISIFLSIILFKNLFCEKVSKIALITLCFIVVMIIFELIGLLFTTVIFRIPVNLVARPTEYRIFAAGVVRFFLSYFLYFMKRLKLSHNHIKKIYTYQLSIILLINIFIGYLIFNLYTKNNIFKNEDMITVVSLTLSMIIFSVMILKITDIIMKYSYKESEWIMRESEYQGQIKYINNMQEFNCKLKAQRHDFNHHIGCIYGLLEVGRIDEVKEYVGKLTDSIQRVNTIVNVENGVIAALLNYKLSIAKEKNIEIKTSIDIPKKFHIDPIDISIVLGNAIDNAIEASEKAREKIIDIEIFMRGEFLIIKIENTKSKNCIRVGDEYKTTKEDKKNHGLGIRNIKFIVKKYDGLLKIDEKKDKFIINIAI
ncbi:sensor histidine kinase [Wukongibacter sp. M2B1]|uniref:sensor histidine kinase n=1 Tax=Wukongibacter sp. M2B1 TaxID=3088895 RepID=UPI003D79D9C6